MRRRKYKQDKMQKAPPANGERRSWGKEKPVQDMKG